MRERQRLVIEAVVVHSVGVLRKEDRDRPAQRMMKIGNPEPEGGEVVADGGEESAMRDSSDSDHGNRRVRDSYTLEDNQRQSVDSVELWDREDSVLVRIGQDKSLVGRIKYQLRRAYNYLIALRGSPEEIALGLSIGLFIAMTPTVGFQMLVAVPVATALRGNPAAAAAGVWLTNPFTIPFLYGLNYWIGASLLGHDLMMTFGENISFGILLGSGSHVWWSLVLGGVITGAFCGLVGYYPTLYVVRAGREQLRRRRERRRLRQLARQQEGTLTRKERRKRKKRKKKKK